MTRMATRKMTDSELPLFKDRSQTDSTTWTTDAHDLPMKVSKQVFIKPAFGSRKYSCWLLLHAATAQNFQNLVRLLVEHLRKLWLVFCPWRSYQFFQSLWISLSKLCINSLICSVSLWFYQTINAPATQNPAFGTSLYNAEAKEIRPEVTCGSGPTVLHTSWHYPSNQNATWKISCVPETPDWWISCTPTRSFCPHSATCHTANSCATTVWGSPVVELQSVLWRP